MNLFTDRHARLWFQAKVPTLTMAGSGATSLTIATGSAARLELLAFVPSLSAAVPTTLVVELPRAQYAASLPADRLRARMDRKAV